MQPTGEKILIKADSYATETKSGLLLAEPEWKTLPPFGEIMAIGPKVTLVKVGDRVMFDRYGSVILAERDMRMSQQSHIIAIIKEDEDGTEE